MTTQEIVSLLLAERDKLNAAIAALGGEAKRRGRPPKAAAPGDGFQLPTTVTRPAKAPVKRKRKLSAAGRAAISAAARKRWRLIKAGKAASPFARAKR